MCFDGFGMDSNSGRQLASRVLCHNTTPTTTKSLQILIDIFYSLVGGFVIIQNVSGIGGTVL